MKQALIKISGHVQGVFFRDNAKDAADSLQLTGYVKNLSDGNVEALVQGSKEDIESFLEWCKEGSPSARVTNIKTDWQEIKKSFDEFTITY